MCLCVCAFVTPDSCVFRSPYSTIHNSVCECECECVCVCVCCVRLSHTHTHPPTHTHKHTHTHTTSYASAVIVPRLERASLAFCVHALLASDARRGPPGHAGVGRQDKLAAKLKKLEVLSVSLSPCPPKKCDGWARTGTCANLVEVEPLLRWSPCRGGTLVEVEPLLSWNPC